MKKVTGTIALILFASSLGLAQAAATPPEAPEAVEPPPAPGRASTPVPGRFMQGPGMDIGGRGMGMRGLGPGKWWKNPELARQLGLSENQIRQMENIFQDHRLKLIDLHPALEKQEALLEPMIEAEHPDENQVLAQIDKVAQARADLEKANARMLLGIRRVLTPEQWKKLQAEREMPPAHRPERRRFRGADRAPGPAAPTPPAAAPPPSE